MRIHTQIVREIIWNKWLQRLTPNREVGSDGGTPRRNSSKSAPVVKKFRFNTCFYPYGVHIIKVLALGPLLAILIFQGSQMILMATKMAMFFRHKGRRHPLMTPLNHCNNERSQVSASVPPTESPWILFTTHFVVDVRFFTQCCIMFLLLRPFFVIKPSATVSEATGSL